MRHVLASLPVLATFTIACASTPVPPPPPAPAPATVTEPALPTLEADDKVPAAYLQDFRAWLRDDHAGIYRRVISVEEVGQGVSVVLERQLTVGGECRVGPSTLTTFASESGFKHNIEHFGDDCCPGSTCAPTPQAYNLRWLQAVAAKDWAKLEQLVPTKGKLTYELADASEGRVKKSKKTYTRRDVAAGNFDMAPGCGFVHTKPSCGDADPKTGAFTCRCDGGGTHTSFEWKREGDGMVVVRIEASSH
jgi:hypothetical protein